MTVYNENVTMTIYDNITMTLYNENITMAIYNDIKEYVLTCLVISYRTGQCFLWLSEQSAC